MTCEEFRALLPQYPDDMDESQREDMLAHAATCPPCAEMLAQHEEMLASLHMMDEELEAPAAFSQSWRKMVKKEAGAQKRPWAVRWQGVIATAAALVVVVGAIALMRDRLAEPVTNALVASPAIIQQGDNALQAQKRNTSDMPTQSDEEAAIPEAEPEVAGSILARETVDAQAPAIVDEGNDLAMSAPSMEEAPEAAFSGDADVQEAGEALLDSPTEAEVSQRVTVWISADQQEDELEALLTLIRSYDERVQWVPEEKTRHIQAEDLQSDSTLVLRLPVEALSVFLRQVEDLVPVIAQESAQNEVNRDPESLQAAKSDYEEQYSTYLSLLKGASTQEETDILKENMTETQEALQAVLADINELEAPGEYVTVFLTSQQSPSYNHGD